MHGILAALGLVLALTAAQAAHAADDSEWKFIVAPYIWAAELEGDVTVRDRTVDVDMSFSDIFDALDAGFLGHFEARRGRWGAFVDMNYLKLSMDKDMAKSGAAIEAELETTQWIVELCGLYTFLDRDLGAQGSGRHLTADVLFGGRYWSVENELDLTLNVGGSVIEADFDADTSWVDPIVGARLWLDITENFFLSLRGDIGGFGIGGASDFSWSLTNLVGFRLADWVTLAAGYKALHVNRDDDSDMDLTIHGPIVGLAFTF